jgi:hypothetical protein
MLSLAHSALGYRQLATGYLVLSSSALILVTMSRYVEFIP